MLYPLWAANRGGHAAGHTSCMRTRGTTLPGAALISSVVVSRIALPAGALSAMIGSDAIGGWSSAHMHGWLPLASCVHALSVASTFMWPYFPWLAALYASDGFYRFVSRSESDHLPIALPLNHVGGITCGVLSILATGGTLDLIPEFKADLVLQRMRLHRPTLLSGVPTMMTLLLLKSTADTDFETLRVVEELTSPLWHFRCRLGWGRPSHCVRS